MKGYQIIYATNSKFKGKKTKTVSKANITSYTLTGLKKGKTYYVKIRAYKKNSKGKNIYGKYSVIRKLRMK